MRKFDLISMCLKNLTRRKVRTLLTIVGVVVGTSAIVVMISIGLGMKESQKQLLSQMGDLSVIEIYNWDNAKDAVLTDEVMHEIMSMEGVLTATPLYQPVELQATLYAGKNDRYETGFYNVTGVYPDAMEHFGYEFLSGDPKNPFPAENSIVLGEMADYNLRDTRKARGQNRVEPWPDAQGNIKPPFLNLEKEKIKLVLRNNQTDDSASGKKNERTLTVTGRVKENFNLGYVTSRGIIMNIQDVKRLEEEYKKLNKIKPDRDAKKGYEEAMVKVTDIKYIESVEKAIQDMGFSTNSMDSIRKPMEENIKKQQTFLGVIAGVSLFVAALGIANTMLMSIYERTREIGIMKVVGCYVEDIRTIFLMEAGCIGFMGGIIGIILSYIISFLMNYFGFSTGMGGGMGGFFAGESPAAAVSIIPLWLVMGALAFSTFIGVASGFYPANRAVKISALTAIKQE